MKAKEAVRAIRLLHGGYKMNASELANKMLEWETMRVQLDKLENEIKAAVLDVGKTQTVGNVRASFSKGRGSYDYEAAFWANNGLQSVASKFTTITTSIDWRGACKELEIDGSLLDDFYSQKSGPSVSLKLMK